MATRTLPVLLCLHEVHVVDKGVGSLKPLFSGWGMGCEAFVSFSI